MSLKNTCERYGVITRLLHWLVAILIIGLIPLGWWMVGLTYFDTWYNDSLAIHKALGMLALLLGVLKVVWVPFNPTVSLGAGLKPWERLAAKSAHHAFYLMMVLIPITGYLISTSAGEGVSIFGLFDVPALVAKNEQLRDLAIELHFYLAYAAGALGCVHAGAALKHQLVDKDGTLRKMLW